MFQKIRPKLRSKSEIQTGPIFFAERFPDIFFPRLLYIYVEQSINNLKRVDFISFRFREVYII